MSFSLIAPRSICTALAVTLAISVSACSRKADESAVAESESESAAHPAAPSPVSPALHQANPATPESSYRRLESGNDIMFLYYALSELPPDIERLASAYSQEFRRAQDAFRKRELIAILQPQIEQQIQAAKSSRYFSYDIRQTLQHYDFNANRFPLSGGLGTAGNWYIMDNPEYRLEFSNFADFTHIPVDDEALARRIEKDVSAYRTFTLRVHAFAQAADPGESLVKAQVVRYRLLDSEGQELLVR